MTSTSPTLLGTYVGFPGTNPTQLASFENAMGQKPNIYLTYVDYTHSPSSWASDQSYTISQLQKSADEAAAIPMIGLPMNSAPTGFSADQFFKGIVAGNYDGAYSGVFQKWANAGYKTFYIRPGWEMNGTWEAWSVTSQNASDFVAAFQHIANLAHSFSGATIKVSWNPNAATPGQFPVDATSLYPGDQYVDIVSIDSYGQSLAPDSSPLANGWSVTTAAQFALAHGKPLGLDETGAETSDTAFPANVAQAIGNVPGVTVDHVNIWDLAGSPNLYWSDNAAAAAAWKQAFGTISADSASAPAPPPGSLPNPTVGTGSDVLVLSISEDAYANGDGTSDAAGDAAFTVSVDGKQLAGIFTAMASHSAHADQTFTFHGDWATGSHTVAVNFLNDAWNPSGPDANGSVDRNLYIDAITYDGLNTNQGATLWSAGPRNFTVTDSTLVPAAVTGAGSDTLIVDVSEDYYLGNANFTVSIDGKQQGGTLTATTLHSSGGSQAFEFAGDFGAGQHTVSVKFVNDAYGGSPSLDRNLYVNDIIYNGIDTKSSASLYSNGSHSFTVSGGTTPTVTETSDHGTLMKNLSQTGTFTVGGDTFVLSAGNAAMVTLGTGTSSIKFTGASSVVLTGGVGQATVSADAGSNKFVAGAGSLDVTGGGGSDAYLFHANSGLLTVEDFSAAKGDTLTIDEALQGSMHQRTDGEGGTMLTFGAGAGQAVDIHGLALMPSSSIVWG